MIAGIFVGGLGTRMGGRAKGRLRARDTGEPLVVRTSRLLRGLGATPVLVGRAEAYADLVPALARLADLPPGVGPLGGLGALLAAAEGEHVLALACDMPWLSGGLLAQLLSAPSEADVLAPRGEAGFWEPLCARYRVARVAPALALALGAREHSFRALFARLDVEELALAPGERRALRDWDREEDMDDA